MTITNSTNTLVRNITDLHNMLLTKNSFEGYLTLQRIGLLKYHFKLLIIRGNMTVTIELIFGVA